MSALKLSYIDFTGRRELTAIENSLFIIILSTFLQCGDRYLWRWEGS